MTRPVLPPTYYLTHFYEMIDFVSQHYGEVLGSKELNFISKLKTLSVSAQCVFVRMTNRKGIVFDQNQFSKYSEIENLNDSFIELRKAGFARSVQNSDFLEIIEFLTKTQMMQWLRVNQIEFLKSLSREELIEIAKIHKADLKIENLSSRTLIVQDQTEHLDYIKFLFFGKIQKNLTLYTLRDLGIRQSQTLKNQYVPRYRNQSEARGEYFLKKSLSQDWSEWTETDHQHLYDQTVALQATTNSAEDLKGEIFFQLGEYWSETNIDKALESWGRSNAVMAREKMARTLYKLGRHQECQAILETIQLDPRNDEELLFAEDFYLRKFNQKKIGTLTEILQNADEIILSEAFLKRPEVGVIKYFANQGFQATFSENNLWKSLFGVLFWNELFESENSKIHNQFERSPSDLVGPEFYLNHERAIEVQLALLNQPLVVEKEILKIVTSKYGQLNDLFNWSPSLGEELITLIRQSQNIDLAKVIRSMAKNFDQLRVGFPDLKVEKNGKLHFIEVKAKGDSLRPNQLSRLRLLKDAGYGVEVLRVRWETDPEQIYVVIDVETTGGTSNFHRVTEVGAVKIQNGKIIDEFQTLINPGRSIPGYITQLTGISNQMVKDAPKFSEIAEKFLAFTEQAIFVAHNVKFDYSFIQKEFQRLEIDFVRPTICTCAGIKKAFKGLTSYGLKNLTTHFNIKLEQHHRAMNDARAAAELFLIMQNERQSRQTVSTDEKNLDQVIPKISI